MAEEFLTIGMQAVVDNIVFNKTQQIAFYRVTDTTYDYLSHDVQFQKLMATKNAFGSLMSDKMKPVECMIMNTTSPFDVESWVDQSSEALRMQNPSPKYEDYVHMVRDILEFGEFSTKETYLAVVIGDRSEISLDKDGLGEVFKGGAKGAAKTLGDALSAFLKTGDKVSQAEEKIARKREKEYYTIVKNSDFKGQRCSAEEILLLLKRKFYPAMKPPYLETDHGNRLDSGDIVMETASVVEEHLKYIKVVQMDEDTGEDVEGFLATLSFSKMPRNSFLPLQTPFFHFFNAEYTMYSRFKLIPSDDMKKKLEKKRQEKRDEIDNYSKGNTSIAGETPGDLQESFAELNEASNEANASRDPWVEAVFRIVLVAPTLEILTEKCQEVRKAYKDAGYVVSWSQGDQLELFLEAMPGDKMRNSSNKQVINLQYLTSTGFNYGSEVGDKIQTPTR